MNDFDKLFLEVKNEAMKLKIPFSPNIDPHIQVNTRAKRRFGMCTKTKDGFSIELSAVLLDVPEISCRQVLAHELIHTCRGCYNHGKLFHKYAEKMNAAYGYEIKSTNTPEELGIKDTSAEKPPKYIIVCTKCGYQYLRSRTCPLVENPSRYLCRCGGKLKRTK